MIVIIGARGFLATHVRLALGDAERMLVSSAPPVVPGLGRSERWIGHDAFAGPQGAEVLRQAAAVIYCAGASVPGHPASNVPYELQRNVADVAALLERLRACAPNARFVYLSSGGTVYGRVEDATPIPETRPLAPISAYGMGKALTEDVIRFAGRSMGLSYAILRIANPVGPYTHSTLQGLAPAILRALRSGQPLPIFGDGGAVRDYVAASDVAEAIVQATHRRDVAAGVWNVGSGRGMTILEMVRLIEGRLGVTVPLAFTPGRSVDVPAVVLDVRRAAADLGWTPRRDLGDVIAEMATM